MPSCAESFEPQHVTLSPHAAQTWARPIVTDVQLVSPLIGDGIETWSPVAEGMASADE